MLRKFFGVCRNLLGLWLVAVALCCYGCGGSGANGNSGANGTSDAGELPARNGNSAMAPTGGPGPEPENAGSVSKNGNSSKTDANKNKNGH